MKTRVLLFLCLIFSAYADENSIRGMFDFSYDSEIIEALKEDQELLKDEKKVHSLLRSSSSSGRIELATFLISGGFNSPELAPFGTAGRLLHERIYS